MTHRLPALFGFALCSFLVAVDDANAQSGSYLMQGTTTSRRVYNRTYSPVKYVAEGKFKIVPTKYNYKKGVLHIYDGQIWVNGPVSTTFYGAYGSIGPSGGTVSSSQTKYTRGMVNQITVTTTNLAPTINIKAWSMSINQYVVL